LKASVDSGPEGESETRGFFPLLFLIALGFEVGGSVIAELWYHFVYLPSIYTGPGIASGPPVEELQTLSSLVNFIVSPCLLFFAFYFYSGKINLLSDGKGVAVSLFAGGFLGSLVSVLTYPLDYLGPNAPTVTSVLSQYGDGWSLMQLLIASANVGVFSLFAGVAAIYFASLREKGKLGAPTHEKPGVSMGGDGQPGGGTGEETSRGT
jgi:hypothetical protein